MRGTRFVEDDLRLLYHGYSADFRAFQAEGTDPPALELAGPRERIFFDPAKLKCGIVTCGGICPGLNEVVRSLVMSLFYHYGIRTVFGFPYGYEGLASRYGHSPQELNPQNVNSIHGTGGSILGSSRGGQDVPDMVDTLDRMNIGILFAIGGDGTLKGAGALAREIGQRGLKISVIGIPKTIDNDISFIQKSFGFETAVTEACRFITSAHIEATGARNGVGLVKLMGRESGFIAAFSALADNNVNFCLVPENPFSMEGFLSSLKERLKRRGHAVVVVAEGAGQDLMQHSDARDASGNVRLGDIGLSRRNRPLQGNRHGTEPEVHGSQLCHQERAGDAPRLGVLPSPRPQCGPCGNERAYGHGGRLLEERIHPRAHSAGRLEEEKDRFGRMALEQRPCLDRAAG
jgi:6-phosphofructokinase 1